MKVVTPSKKLKNFVKIITKTMQENVGDLSEVEVLAALSQMVGIAIANCDQRKLKTAQAMNVVAVNIEMGNKRAVDELLNKTSGNA